MEKIQAVKEALMEEEAQNKLLKQQTDVRLSDSTQRRLQSPVTCSLTPVPFDSRCSPPCPRGTFSSMG